MRQLRRRQNADVEDVSKKMSDALNYGNLDVVKRLITKYGLSYHRDWLDGCALLQKILRFNNNEELAKLVSRTEIAEFLIAAGAKTTNTKNGIYILHEAVGGYARRCSPIVKSLLINGASTNSRNNCDDTPLHCARTAEIARLLFSRHAVCRPDVEAINDVGLTPLHVAAFFGNEHVAKVLLENGANIDSECVISDPDLRLLKGFTPLHFATCRNEYSLVEFLLKNGAAVNSSSEKGTPLHIASDSIIIARDFYYWYCLKYLLVYGGDVNIPTKNGKTVIEIVENTIPVAEDNVAQEELRALSKRLQRHVAMLKIADLHVSKENLRAYEKTKNHPNLVKRCEDEVLKMKITRVGDSCVTYYDILSQPPNRVAIYTRNAGVTLVMDSEDCLQKFPLYGGMIENRYRRAERRVKLLGRARASLSSIFQFLPEICIDLIADFLCNGNLMKLTVSDCI